MSITIAIEAVPTGQFTFACYANAGAPATHGPFNSYEDAITARAAHRTVCSECDTFGCFTTATLDVNESITWANLNAETIFGFLGIPLINEDGECAGILDANTILSACYIAFATGTPVLHARPTTNTLGSVNQNTHNMFGEATIIDCGLSETEILDRVADLADLATEAARLNRNICWN